MGNTVICYLSLSPTHFPLSHSFLHALFSLRSRMQNSNFQQIIWFFFSLSLPLSLSFLSLSASLPLSLIPTHFPISLFFSFTSTIFPFPTSWDGRPTVSETCLKQVLFILILKIYFFKDLKNETNLQVVDDERHVRSQLPLFSHPRKQFKIFGMGEKY